ncbi:MAG: hypothetical protein HON90_15125, partial [Halobacteriovoraceae bacterium]|nr:hypothetical protein [Halobacteriovoraceae bacterium]
MRAIITLFLIFTPVLVISAPAKVLSQVCSRKYVEGVKRERPNGQIVRECLYRATLPDSYETDTASRCSRTHVEGSWVFSSNSFHYK